MHLRALDVLESAMAERPDPAALLEQHRPDLEVLSRDDLIRVVVAVAVEASVVTGRTSRPRVRDRLAQRRLNAMWAS